jgi:hypothetical protein
MFYLSPVVFVKIIITQVNIIYRLLIIFRDVFIFFWFSWQLFKGINRYLFLLLTVFLIDVNIVFNLVNFLFLLLLIVSLTVIIIIYLYTIVSIQSFIFIQFRLQALSLLLRSRSFPVNLLQFEGFHLFMVADHL